MGVISSSIGSAAGIYLLVSITGYLTFGDDIKGNIVSMCMSYIFPQASLNVADTF
jgi:amino acid permease